MWPRSTFQLCSSRAEEISTATRGMAALVYAVTASPRGTPQSSIKSLFHERVRGPLAIADEDRTIGYWQAFGCRWTRVAKPTRARSDLQSGSYGKVAEWRGSKPPRAAGSIKCLNAYGRKHPIEDTRKGGRRSCESQASGLLMAMECHTLGCAISQLTAPQ